MNDKFPFDPFYVIQEMVTAARKNVSKNDTLYNLYWGYVSVFICLLVYIFFNGFLTREFTGFGFYLSLPTSVAFI